MGEVGERDRRWGREVVGVWVGRGGWKAKGGRPTQGAGTGAPGGGYAGRAAVAGRAQQQPRKSVRGGGAPAGPPLGPCEGRD